MVISTGMTLPRWDSVAALYCLQKSMMLRPCGPRAVHTGGAGVAAPALSCTLTTAEIFFFLGGMTLCPLVPVTCGPYSRIDGQHRSRNVSLGVGTLEPRGHGPRTAARPLS